MLSAPVVIIDEYNRALPEITNILQGYLVNGTLVFEGGKEIVPGVKFDDKVYQWKIATLNEGEKYYGARSVDKALKNRFGAVINFDIFEPTDMDRRAIIIYGGCKKLLEVMVAVYKMCLIYINMSPRLNLVEKQ